MKYLNTYDNTTVPGRSDTLLGVDNPSDPAWAVKQFTVENLDKALETVQAVVASTAATSVDLSVARNAVVTLQADTEITFSNVPYPASGRITLEQDDTGGWVVTFGTAIAWAGGSAPSIGTTADGRYVIRWWTDGSNQIYAEYVGEATPAWTETPALVTDTEMSLGDDAMFWTDGVDMSPWAGTDAGYTPYLFEFVDGAGLKATAYGGAAGGGLTLGSELVPQPLDFTSGWNMVLGGTAIDSDTWGIDPAGSGGVICASASLSKYALYQTSLAGDCNRDFIVRNGGGSIDQVIVNAGVFDNVIYSCLGYESGAKFYLVASGGPIVSVYNFTSLSVKQVTDVPITGLHLFTSQDGTTRGLASLDTGFNPGNIVEINWERVD